MRLLINGQDGFRDEARDVLRAGLLSAAARVVSMGNANTNSLAAYGLAFDSLNIFQEYGLIISDYNSYGDWRPAVVHDGKVVVAISYQKRQWAFVPKSVSSSIHNAFNVHGVAFSRAGRDPTSNTPSP
jgi:hypothetical protein